MRFREVCPQVFMASRGGVNMYVIAHSDGTVLIDAGLPGGASALIAALARFPDLAGVVLTHGHYDHVGGAAVVARARGVPVWMHPDDAALLAEGRWRRAGRASPTLHGPLLKRLVADRYPDEVPALADVLPAQKAIPLAGGIEVIHCPGHSAGQVALVWREAGVVFAADVVMHILGLREPILYEDRAEGLASIRRLAEAAEGASLMVFGHGGPLRDPGPPIARFARRLEGVSSHGRDV
ncbi:MBL fold metallo-hydrolase [Aestuariibius sp. 2305UL40-4]|uniref:MBL fold metallo-hydrolase n=1 Tax=Aestuariibius violaceus TaxID=3234132 RepID=UPI00345E471F